MRAETSTATFRHRHQPTKKGPRTLPELLALRTSGEGSESPFLVGWEEARPENVLTFRQFGARVHVGVLHLRRQHVKQGTHVGLLAHNSVDFWVLSMAVICCNGVCVLLNHRQPLAALIAMAEAAAVTRLITSDSLINNALQILECAQQMQGPLLWVPSAGTIAPNSVVDVRAGDGRIYGVAPMS